MAGRTRVGGEPAAAEGDGARPVEITDLLWSCDPVSGARLPVRRDDVLAALEQTGQRRAARLARALPTSGPYLDDAAVDALLLRVHAELQRLGEELRLPRRLAETLLAWSRPLLQARPEAPVRVVDVGCGLGFALRWLSAHGVLGPRVELVGVDVNTTLVRRATALADAEGLTCRFEAGDAFTPGLAVEDPDRTILVSSGLLHHLAPAQLAESFAAQQALRVSAFAHFDIEPGRWTTVGAWVFHRARMREGVSRHDGVLSARRAHPAATLRAAAGAGAPDYVIACPDPRRGLPALSQVLRPVTGTLSR